MKIFSVSIFKTILFSFTMKKLFLFYCLSFIGAGLCTAQSSAKTEKSDPAAKTILDKLKTRYESYKSIEATFTLTIELAESKKADKRAGKLAQEGDQYRLETDNETIISDGKTVWLCLKDKNQVQISDADAKDKNAFVSPKQLLRMYENKEFVYSIVGEGVESGKACRFIEFKPVKKNSDYTKLRMAVDKANEVVSIRAFGRDGSKYTLQLHSLKANAAKNPAGYFTFNANEHKGVKVEDLRMD